MFMEWVPVLLERHQPLSTFHDGENATCEGGGERKRHLKIVACFHGESAEAVTNTRLGEIHSGRAMNHF
jgi:hypothetical protein